MNDTIGGKYLSSLRDLVIFVIYFRGCVINR